MAKKKEAPELQGTESPASDAGSTAGLLVGVCGALAAVCFFLPWYSKGSTSLSGLAIVRGQGEIPPQLIDGFANVGGNLFIGGLLATAILAAVGGLAFKGLRSRFGSAVVVVHTVIGANALLQGLVLLLNLTNMKVIKNIDEYGVMMACSLFAVGLLEIALLASVDRAEHRGEGALPASTWTFWISTVAFTTLFHYIFVCYKLVLPGPEALRTKLARFSVPLGK